MFPLRIARAAAFSFSICASLAAQPELFSKAPPASDNALRDRVGKFYQAHLEGKFRLADQYVAEESKDAFFEADKIHFRSWKIERIDYSENFTRAKVLTACGVDFRRAGQTVQVTMPVVSTWKVENGAWFWYYIAPTKVETPWGIMQGGPGESKSPSLPNLTAAAADILRRVTLDRSEVMLSSFEKAEEEVQVRNGMPGEIRLRVEYEGFRGLAITLDRNVVKAGEQARLLLACNPADRVPKPTVTARVIVESTGQVLPVKVTFAVPPEIQRQLPK